MELVVPSTASKIILSGYTFNSSHTEKAELSRKGFMHYTGAVAEVTSHQKHIRFVQHVQRNQ